MKFTNLFVRERIVERTVVEPLTPAQCFERLREVLRENHTARQVLGELERHVRSLPTD